VNAAQTALWWARARALGPALSPAGTPAPDGFLRLPDPDSGEVWLLPAHPGTAGPWVLDELGLAGPTVEQPNETARLLAAVVRCCWPDPEAEIWPGQDADWETVLSVYRTFGDRDELVLHRAAIGSVRRLHSAGWVLWDEDRRVVRLGPRCGTWVSADLTVLRELWRNLAAPQLPDDPAEPAEPAAQTEPDTEPVRPVPSPDPSPAASGQTDAQEPIA